jgi:uncharacterized protein with HEPN domain
MFDLILADIQRIEETILHILDRTQKIVSTNDFLLTPEGIDLLDAVCLRLLVMGEEVKKLDKHSNGELLPKYPSVIADCYPANEKRL